MWAAGLSVAGMLMVWVGFNSSPTYLCFAFVKGRGNINKPSRQTLAICCLWEFFFALVFHLLSGQLFQWFLRESLRSVKDVFSAFVFYCLLDAVVHRLSIWRWCKFSGSGSAAIKWPDSRHGPAVEYSSIYLCYMQEHGGILNCVECTGILNSVARILIPLENSHLDGTHHVRPQDERANGVKKYKTSKSKKCLKAGIRKANRG